MKITYIKLINFRRFPLRDSEIFEHTFTSKLLMITGPNGCGKAQPLNSLIKIPNGWDLMGNMKVGTNILAKDGTIVKVNGVFPQGKKEIFKLTFKDGRTTRATSDHLWRVYIGNYYSTKAKILTTLELISLLEKNETLIWIDLPESEQNEDKKLPIDPYTLGANIQNNYDKIIPDIYLNSSHTQRLKLIQGLMDTNGIIDGIRKTVSYSTTNHILAKQLQYLIRSIGGIASISNKNNEKITNKIIYQVDIKYNKPSELFSHPRKKELIDSNNQYLEILKIELSSIISDGFEEAQCISIDHPDHLYVTDDFIVTHNTSLFNELTPLPSDKNNFIAGKGYKEIHIEKDKQLYKLISDFTDGTKYYFYVGDENLNVSCNITTQRELVFKHFGITETIHDILIGTENFTDMSLLNRKKLFNSITHLNIDKVIDNYNHLKEEYKNNELLLKTQISLSQAEEQKLINTDHFNNLLTSQKQIKDYIDVLLDIRMYIHQYINNIDINEAAQNFLGIQKKIQTVIDNYYTYLTSYSTDERNNYKTKLEIIDYKLNNLYLLLETKQKEINILNLNKQHDLKALKAELELLINNRNKILSSLYMFKVLDRPIEYLRNDILKLEVSLIEIIRTIPLNENKRFSKEKYEKLLNRKQEALDELNKVITREIKINQDMQHLIKHKQNVVCPKCSYSWSLLDTNDSMIKLKTEHKQVLKMITELQAELAQIDKDLTELLNYFALYKQYSALRNATYDNLKPFWTLIDKNEFIFKDPAQINTLFKNAIVEIESLAEADNIYKRIQELTKNIEMLSTIKDTNIENLKAEIEEINVEISSIQDEKEKLTSYIKNNETSISANLILNTSRNLLEHAIKNIQDANLSFTIKNILNVVESELSKYKVILIETECEINNYNNIKYTIEKYKKIIDDIQSNIKVLNIILTELSPKNGLIAKSVSSFLNIIIENINTIINTVWEYKMVLKAINIEDEVLNYKFKVEVEDKITIEDITKVSSGMKEIINLSFKTVLYRLLKFENYPIFLDEFGVKLDKVHRSKISELVFKMINSNYYSQIFLITHIDTSYAIFRDVEELQLG